MLPAAHRLRRSVDFQRTVRSGVRAGRSTLVVHLTRDPEGTDEPRVGFVVSKAVGNAVRRNAVKRRLRAVMAGELAGLPDRSRIVVRALPHAVDATFEELRADAHAGIAKATARSSARDLS